MKKFVEHQELVQLEAVSELIAAEGCFVEEKDNGRQDYFDEDLMNRVLNYLAFLAS